VIGAPLGYRPNDAWLVFPLKCSAILFGVRLSLFGLVVAAPLLLLLGALLNHSVSADFPV
jgi:hypothetical protein